MKSFLVSAVACCILVASCKSKSASAVPEQDSTKLKAMTSVDERTEKKQALQKLTPYGLEEMQKIMPASIDGMKETNFNYSMQWGYAYATADYNKTKAFGITLTIYDCAGHEGSDFCLDNFYDRLSQPKQDSIEYVKVIDMMGGKAIESYNKQVDYATLTYIIGDRILIVMQGKKMKPEELKAIAKKLKLKA